MEEKEKQQSFTEIIQSTKNSIIEIDKYKNTPVTAKARNLMFLAMVASGFVFIVMFGLQILASTFALFLSIVLLAFTIYGVRFLKNADPLIKQKQKNFIMKQRIKEVRENAIYQLQNEVVRKTTIVEKSKETYAKVLALVNEMKSHARGSSEESRKKKEKMIQTKEKMLKKLEERIKEQTSQAKLFEEKVKEYKDMQKFIDISKEADEHLGDVEFEKTQELLTIEAFEAIDKEFYQQQAKFEVESKDF